MKVDRQTEWLEWNQTAIAASLSRIRELLGAARDGLHSGDPTTARRRDSDPSGQLDDGQDDGSRLGQLCRWFGLSAFERDLLMLCAGVELDSTIAESCARRSGGAPTGPTFGLALSLFPNPHWSALAPSAPLRRWKLIEGVVPERLSTSPLHIDERVLHFLAGVDYLDPRLGGLVTAIPAPETLPPSQAAAAARVAELWSSGTLGAAPIVHLHGRDPDGRREVAAGACASAGLSLHAMRASRLPPAGPDRESFARLWEREATLLGSALLIEIEEGLGPDLVEDVVDFVGRIATVTAIGGREPVRPALGTVVLVEVPVPGGAEQADLWRAALGPAAAAMNGAVERAATHFRLSPAMIRSVSARLTGEAAAGELSGRAVSSGDGSDEAGRRLWRVIREQARGPLEDLARRIEPVAVWQDLVLPEEQLEVLRQIASHVRWRETVYERWGFATKGQRGLGISALFVGTSGTGKTMAAEVLARELDLDVFQIDLSAVVSKYIGETEKNLRRVFDAAERTGAVLLFDEADALFGKRSEVRDSHDRYANVEVSYLLQRMEEYRGLAILTTNLRKALDEAFLRRIRFVVQFPFPDSAQRAEIWRRVFPSSTPTEGIDPNRLARLTVPGGNIRNIALQAAFLAADEGLPVGMPHLVAAARSEYAKLERPLTARELGGEL